jgi:predicted Holliday junction resolvase-like endonuclease
MSLVRRLLETRGLQIRCPNCDGEFPVKQAQLFDSSGTLPRQAAILLQEGHDDISEQRDELRRRRKAAKEKPEIGATAVRIGKVVEKIAPALRGFPADPTECRSLFEPIDYIVFSGLSKGAIESVHFVDIKSGRASLGRQQRIIRSTIEAGRVSLKVIDALGVFDEDR